ncbi:hypothetical protein KVP06_06815 [Geobacter sulfurreducens]|uniref:Uncharacterized protein n=1 Tax=Geobacter sulfurreducens (strain ATCC 51573 / DSM 12127 / PCA) TaxID=243231 RepID=Q74DF4_GEOSL|nr:hypothetical protein [Geobacter sulfurreducens]AAR34738.1 hypothetical protein GSU1362 [Geobacter sulfurreducens PCA]UAC05386.1 hypothetical protein KVP06_06815 [Geobacter sulfurreducens]
MDLIEIADVREWLSQFSEADIPIAISMLRSLNLVSHNAFSAGIENSIKTIVKKHGKAAVFPVKRALVKKVPGKDYRHLYQSADAIGYLLTNLERSMPRSISVEPTHASMKAEKVKHIVFIDDLIGTGKRVNSFWQEWANKSYKSWLSFRYCELYILSYAASRSGIEYLLNEIPYLKPENILTSISLPRVSPLANDEMKRICNYYGEKTAKSVVKFGYGNQMLNVIFQHACPNNAPSILWSPGKQWKALFPNRSIPASFHKVFGGTFPFKIADSLWDIHQPRLALEILDRLESGRIQRETVELLTVLGFLARGVGLIRIYECTLLEKSRVDEAILILKQVGLVTKNFEITSFGKEVLNRFKATDKRKYELVCDQLLYYPHQFKGLQRKSSEGPT